MLAESIVFELCRSGGLDENLKVVNAALRERRDALVEALREHIPEAEFVVPEGGYFLWLDLKDDVDTEALLADAKEEGVTFVAGPDFMLDGGSSSLRLSFAPVPAGDVAEGVQRLARALERLRSGSRAGAERRLDPVVPGSPGAPVEVQVLGPGRVGLAPLLVRVSLDRPGDRDQPCARRCSGRRSGCWCCWWASISLPFPVC